MTTEALGRAMPRWAWCERMSAWPRVARWEASVRAWLAPQNLLAEDFLREITIYATRDGKIQVHHPVAGSREDLIEYANMLLIASQVIAAQAGAQVVSQPQTLAQKESHP